MFNCIFKKNKFYYSWFNNLFVVKWVFKIKPALVMSLFVLLGIVPILLYTNSFLNFFSMVGLHNPRYISSYEVFKPLSGEENKNKL